MIHYQLRCGSDHAFDGWFRDSAAFDGQAKRGLLSCPLCGSTGVRRALMAPALGRKRNRAAPAPAPETASQLPQAAAPSQSLSAQSSASQSSASQSSASQSSAELQSSSAPVAAVAALPDHVRAMLQKMRAEVEKRCDYVGGAFADQARKMHDGDIEARPIYGEATPEQAQRLNDDGIEVAQIPWIPRADS